MPDLAPPAPGPYLQTVSGRWVNPFDPDPEQLDAGDIARALANQCRFGGHSRIFYSVAQHSVIVSELVQERGGDVEDAFAALMHDATEADLGDMPHPIKHRSQLGAAFKEAEDQLEQVIRARFGIKADVAGGEAGRSAGLITLPLYEVQIDQIDETPRSRTAADLSAALPSRS